MRTPALRPCAPGLPVVVVALSGLGKSTLAAAHPERVIDGDRFLYEAVGRAFPDLDARAQLRAWRALCRGAPWAAGDEAELARWARARRDWTGAFVDAVRTSGARLVLTSMLHPPWHVSAYYGVERGRYLEHLRVAGREVDNLQSEAGNDRLEGYGPLVRLGVGEFLGERGELLRVIAG